MKAAVGSVSTKGQVTIPQEIREQLGIRPGDKVWISVEGSSVVMRPADLSLLAGYRSIPALKRPLTDEEMDDLIDEEIVEDFKRSTSRED
jgi:AbrB family looped-hinge helix DNA binding protein